MQRRASMVFLAVSAILSGFFSGPVAGQDATPSYVARAVQGLPGQIQREGRVAKSAVNLRLEYDQGGRRIIQIIRPGDGAVYMLDPKAQSYVELPITGPPMVPGTGYVSPCPEPVAGALCRKVGEGLQSGFAVERWALSAGADADPLVIMWDWTRRQALRQDFPDGSRIVMEYVGLEPLNERPTEHWDVVISQPRQPNKHVSWWFDPELRVATLETMLNGEIRRLQDIEIGPVDPALFRIPEGWAKQVPADFTSSPATPSVDGLNEDAG